MKWLTWRSSANKCNGRPKSVKKVKKRRWKKPKRYVIELRFVCLLACLFPSSFGYPSWHHVRHGYKQRQQQQHLAVICWETQSTSFQWYILLFNFFANFVSSLYLKSSFLWIVLCCALFCHNKNIVFSITRGMISYFFFKCFLWFLVTIFFSLSFFGWKMNDSFFSLGISFDN